MGIGQLMSPIGRRRCSIWTFRRGWRQILPPRVGDRGLGTVGFKQAVTSRMAAKASKAKLCDAWDSSKREMGERVELAIHEAIPEPVYASPPFLIDLPLSAEMLNTKVTKG